MTDTLNRTITFLRSARSIEDVRRPIAVMPLLEALVEKVLVYEDEDHSKRVEVVMKYSEDFEVLCAALEEINGDVKQ